MQLKVGLLQPEPGWKLLLDQIGVWWEPGIDFSHPLSDHYSLIIINAEISNTAEINQLKTYLENGGAVLDLGHFLNRIAGFRVGRTFKKTFYTEALDFYTPDQPMDIYRNIWLHPDGELCEGAIHREMIGQGAAAFLGLEIAPLMVDERASYKEFYNNGNIPPFEHVSLVSKNEIRKLVYGLMKWLHISRDIPFVHKWHLPDGANNLVLFRVDTDFGTKKEINKLAELAHEHEMPVSWFLHVEAHEDWLDTFQHFETDELALHGYKHRITSSYKANTKNIGRGLDKLHGSDIDPKGYAAPYGFWNPFIAEAIHNHGFLYSSEFSFSHDTLPFYAESYRPDFNLLQIPVHPICIGSFRRLKCNAETVNRYFSNIIERKRRQFEPVALYHHPKDGHHEVLATLFEVLNRHEYKKTTFSEYARWWEHRQETGFTAKKTGQGVEIKQKQTSRQITVAEHRSSDEFVLWQSDGNGRFNALRRESLEPVESIPVKELKKIRGFKPHLIKQSVLDFIYRLKS